MAMPRNERGLLSTAVLYMYALGLSRSGSRRSVDTAPATRSRRPPAVAIQGMELRRGALDHQLCLLARDALVCAIPQFVYPALSMVCAGYRPRMAVQTSRSGMQRMSTVFAHYSARTARSPLAYHRYCAVGIGILLVRDVCSMHGAAP